MNKRLLMGGICLTAFVFCFSGCAHKPGNNQGHLQSYPVTAVESGWIRDGQPIEFDGTKWYPVDDVEIFLDLEVYQVGEYKGTLIFVDKLDIKPYKRLYTKFAKNKFRYFERRNYD